jgi:hypothetical protein
LFQSLLLSFLDPNENDRQEFMKITKMSASQITIWFTNARAKMRKENKLSTNITGKKKKKNQQNHAEETLIVLDDDIYELINISPPIQMNSKRIVIAYSSLNIEQIVC